MSHEQMVNLAVEAVKRFVAQQLEEIKTRVADVEKSIVAPVAMAEIEESIKKMVDEIPKPKDGRDGESVSLVQLASVIHETVAEAVSKIAPIKGEPGKDGASVTAEDILPTIKTIIKKEMSTIVPERGMDGRDGRDGRDGTDGRDAMDIDILPCIEQERSYAWGTYAHHKGGLWKAVKNTRGMDGWQCIVDGIASVEIDYDGERGVTVKTNHANGDVVSKKIEMPMILDKGVYRSTESYKKFDAVTYSGSLWIAQEDAPKGTPGTDGSGFRLAVKAGRNAKAPVKVGA